MGKTFRVKRTETITYEDTFTLDQLVEMGMDLSYLDDEPTAEDIQYHLRNGAPERVYEIIERHGDVEDAEWHVEEVAR